MGPVQSIKTCLRKSLQTSGRTARTEFWWFAPVGIALPAIAAILAPPAINSWGTLLLKISIVLLAAVPFFSAMQRRYQDTGMHGQDVWVALGPTIMVITSGWFLIVGVFGIVSIIHAIVGAVFFLIMLPIFVINLVIAPGTLGTAIGQLLIPSESSSNRYGPNPNEALS